jgi:Tfp pilus assembly protein PilP
MKRTTSILVCTLAAGMAWAQNPQIIQDVRAKMNTVQQNNTAASNEALGIKATPAKAATAKPAAAPVKISTATVKASAAPVKANVAPAKANAAPAKVSVVSAKASTSSPKASVVAAKTTPSAPKATVVPAKANTSSAKATVTPATVNVSSVKPSVSSTKPSVATATHTSPKQTAPFAEKKTAKTAAPKLGIKPVTAKKESKPAAVPKKAAAAPKTSATPVASASKDANTSPSEEAKGNEDDAVKDAQEKKWSMSGKRDPFISPVVSRAGGSGCSTGKKCLEIGAINLRGVVHSDGGFIAVITNNMNKAYFLRENDPVFNGYVVKITGDSIVFKETVQDRLGKSFTREVTKKIATPAV